MNAVTRTLSVCLCALWFGLVACHGTMITWGEGDDVDARIDDPDPLPPGVPDASPPPIQLDGGVAPGPTPPADAAPPPQPDASPDYESLSVEEKSLFDTINEERVSRGMGTVELRGDLICAATKHSNDIGTLGICGHTGSDGSGPGDRVAACQGSGWSGEIVACGQSTPREAVDAWIWSPGHAAIMFDSGQVYIGVAMHNNYWTAIFDR